MKKKIALLLTFVMLMSVLALSGCSAGGPKFEGTWYFYDLIDAKNQAVCTEYEQEYKISRELSAGYFGIDVKLVVAKDNKYALAVDGEEISNEWDTDVTTDDSISQIFTLKGINAKAYFKNGDNSTLYVKYPGIGVIALKNKALDLNKAAADLKTLKENNLSLSDYIEILDGILSRRPDAKLKNDIEAMLELDRSVQYEDAIALKDSGEYVEAIAAFEAMDGYKDSVAQIENCRTAIKDINYNKAVDLANAGQYDEAIAAFKALDDYKDSTSKIGEVKAAKAEKEAAAKRAEEERIEAKNAAAYAAAEELLANGEKVKAAIAFGKLGNYKDARERSFDLWDAVAVRETASAGNGHTVGMKSDGTAIAVGNNEYGQCEVSEWTDIVVVSAGYDHTVGLKSDGTVVAVGYNKNAQCDISGWTDIVAVSAGLDHTVGLKNDGTVVAVGNNSYDQCEVSEWTDIVAVSAGSYHTAGLESDGTAVAVGSNSDGQCEVSDWMDIVAVSVGSRHTVGLKSDGTVVAVGSNKYGQCDVSDWTDIVAVNARGYHTVGLKSDGTVVAVGSNKYGQCDVSTWTDIVAISAGAVHTVGLKSDGAAVATRYSGDQTYNHGQCNVSDWTDIVLPNK